MNTFRPRALLTIGRGWKLPVSSLSLRDAYFNGLGPRVPQVCRLNSTKNDIFKLDIELPGDDLKPPTSVVRPKEEQEVFHTEREQRLQDINSLFDDLVNEGKDSKHGGAEVDADNDNRFSEIDTLLDEISEHSELKTFDREFDTTSKVFSPDTESPKSVIESENELFRKIFETYSKTQESEVKVDRLQKQVLINLQESFTKQPEAEAGAMTTEQAKPKIHKKELHSLEKLPQKDAETLEKQSLDSVSQTIQYLNDITSKRDLLLFAKDFFTRFNSQMLHQPDFFLHKLKGETVPEYLQRHEKFCTETKELNSQNPKKPVLNAFTMPLIFNHMLEITCHRFYDGSLALSLFNMTKNDLNLYSIICNQRTYNEVIKILWVFYGKSSLCEIELILVEMMNNGFEGDWITFSTLKEILTLHHKMRIGDTIYNPGGSPIWSREDEKRAKNIEEKFRKLGKRLSRKRLRELAN